MELGIIKTNLVIFLSRGDNLRHNIDLVNT